MVSVNSIITWCDIIDNSDARRGTYIGHELSINCCFFLGVTISFVKYAGMTRHNSSCCNGDTSIYNDHISNTFRTPISSGLSLIVMTWFLNNFYKNRAGHSNEDTLFLQDDRVLHIIENLLTVLCVASHFVPRSFGDFL